MEFYNFDNQVFKIINIKSTQSMEEGKYIIKDMTVKNLITGRSSEMTMNKNITSAKIDDSVFSLQNLER